MSREEDAELAETLQKALRRPKFGQLEQLLANELAIAVFHVDPLQKIRHILEAYMVLSKEEKVQVFNKEEQEIVEKIYRVCISLLNVVEYQVSEVERLQSVPFDFPEEQAEKYLGLFFEKPGEFYKLLCMDAHPVNVVQFKVRFIYYSMPFTLQVMRRIIENFISPETWNQTLQQARRQAKL